MLVQAAARGKLIIADSTSVELPLGVQSTKENEYI